MQKKIYTAIKCVETHFIYQMYTRTTLFNYYTNMRFVVSEPGGL